MNASKMKKYVSMFAAAVCLSLSAAVDLPELFGDGVHDDTAAIQARLDSGVSCVYLQPPKKEYLISKTLIVHSRQELRLDRYTRIRLAPWSNCPMVSNANRRRDGGDSQIAIVGGIWDCDNTSQKCNPARWKFSDNPEKNKPESWPDKKYHPGRYLGVGMDFYNVKELEMRNLTIRNPVTYGIMFCRVSYFTVENIEFDFPNVNPCKSNMDGVHLNGWCHHGRIANIRGTCFDDEIALNANEGCYAVEEGPITDIDIDGVYAEYSHSAVRLLSASDEAPVRRVTISNIHGHFFRYMVGLTRFMHTRPGRGVMDDIVIRDCFGGSALWPADLPEGVRAMFSHMPVVFCDNGLDIGNLTITGFHRVEADDPVPTISVGGGTAIRRLTVRDCSQENRTDRPLVFLQNRGRVDGKVLENIDLVPVEGAAENVLYTEEKVWTDKGHAADLKAAGLPCDGFYPDTKPGVY